MGETYLRQLSPNDDVVELGREVYAPSLREICKMINLCDEVTDEVLRLAVVFDPVKLDETIAALCDPLRADEGLKLLEEVTTPVDGEPNGNKPSGFAKLAVCLTAARETYKKYEAMGINNETFATTMGCFSRFVNEHKVSYGVYGFDREWWTTRQLSLRLFRIGELEYELRQSKTPDTEAIGTGANCNCCRRTIAVHIPSDACLSAEKRHASYAAARVFIAQHFPAYADSECTLHTWLLYPGLSEVLSPNSRILDFQRDYDIVEVDHEDKGFMHWVFKNSNLALEELPEDTSLQRRVKELLISGRTLGSAWGRLKQGFLL